jgi:hypothetical protein
MKAIEYREITETVCPLDAVSCLLCSKVKLLKPHGRFTPHGDETVVSESAAYMNGNHFSQYYFDLDKVENERIPIIGTKISHANLTETSQVQDFLSQIIKSGSSSDVEFFSVESPIFTKVYDIEEINSPVQISAKDSQGRVTGMVFENGEWLRKLEIPDTNYVEFGGTKYLITPATLERVTTLRGETLGGYTLTLSTFDGNGIQTKKHEVVDATSTPTMVALYSKTNGEFTTIKTDYNSDGVYEYENTIDGVYVAPPPLYTYSTLTGYINSLSIKKLYKDALLLIAREAERLHTKASGNNTYAKLEKVTLKFLESTVNLYNRQQILTKTQADEILKMITFLSK